jgi:hypothetical protein
MGAALGSIMPTIITAHMVSTNTNSAALHGLSAGASMEPISLIGPMLMAPPVAGMFMPSASHRT